MSESKKLLIGFTIVGVICACLAGMLFLGFRSFSRNIENMADPTQIVEIQEEIAEFDMPPGYAPMAMSILIYDMLYLTPVDAGRGPMIMFMQYSGEIGENAEYLEDQLKQAAEQQNDQSGVQMEVVDTFEEVIRGQTVTVVVSEGTNQGLTWLQWMTTFQGNNGLVILMIQGTADEWDEKLVNDFVRSIR
jgi:hypothetical protein